MEGFSHVNAFAAKNNFAYQDTDGEDQGGVQLFKTEHCRFWRSDSGCRHGPSCPFAHGERELQSRPDLSKTSMCHRFVQGCCPLSATECRFAHGPHDIRKTSGASPAMRKPTPEELVNKSRRGGCFDPTGSWGPNANAGFEVFDAPPNGYNYGSGPLPGNIPAPFQPFNSDIGGGGEVRGLQEVVDTFQPNKSQAAEVSHDKIGQLRSLLCRLEAVAGKVPATIETDKALCQTLHAFIERLEVAKSQEKALMDNFQDLRSQIVKNMVQAPSSPAAKQVSPALTPKVESASDWLDRATVDNGRDESSESSYTEARSTEDLPFLLAGEDDLKFGSEFPSMVTPASSVSRMSMPDNVRAIWGEQPKPALWSF